MTIALHIDSFAREHGGCFTKKELTAYLFSKGIRNAGTIDKTLQRMVASGRLDRLGTGIYQRADGSKPIFHISPSDDVRVLYEKLKNQFPLLKFVVWDAQALLPLMHNIPNVQMTIVSVEKDGFIDIAETLETLTEKLVFRNPDRENLLHLGSGREYIVVRPMVSQSPVEEVEGVRCPTIEKVLVDILRDKEFYYLRGGESYYIYESILADYSLNKKALMRYACRRNAADDVSKLIHTYNYDTSGEPHSQMD